MQRTEYIIRIFVMAMAAGVLLLASGCDNSQSGKKVVVVPTVKPASGNIAPLPSVDIAMMSRSLVDALRMGEKLDSSSYNFLGILTDGQGKPLYTGPDGKPGHWKVTVESPSSVVIQNLEAGNLPAEDLRVYIAQSIGLTDADVADAGIAAGTDSVQAVIYKAGELRMELTLRPVTDASGTEHAMVSIAFIRIDKKKNPPRRKTRRH